MGKHNEFGKQGEQIAADFLLKKGYKILHKNYRHQKAEVDIIAQKGQFLCIVEVKTRTGDFLEEITETINQKKINLLLLAADHYVQEHDLDLEVRFDIILILKKNLKFEVEHVKNAFYHF